MEHIITVKFFLKGLYLKFSKFNPRLYWSKVTNRPIRAREIVIVRSVTPL